MSELAILGGDPVRCAAFSHSPQYLPSDAARLHQELLRLFAEHPTPLVRKEISQNIHRPRRQNRDRRQ
jgi:hypothetical protein